MWNDFAYKCIQYNLSLMWSQLDIGYKDQRGLYSPLKGQSIGQFFIQRKAHDLIAAIDFFFETCVFCLEKCQFFLFSFSHGWRRRH